MSGRHKRLDPNRKRRRGNRDGDWLKEVAIAYGRYPDTGRPVSFQEIDLPHAMESWTWDQLREGDFDGTNAFEELAVVEDVVDLRACRDGYIVAASGLWGYRENWPCHDLAVARVEARSALDGFYFIPLVQCDSDDEESILRAAERAHADTGDRRFFVRSPAAERPWLVDYGFVDTKGATEARLSPYLVTSFSRLLERGGERGMRMRDAVEFSMAEFREQMAPRPVYAGTAAIDKVDSVQARCYRDHFRGALLGTAVGDALGMPLDRRSAQETRAFHGVVDEMLHGWLPRGSCTEDTRLMIALAESLLETLGKLPPGSGQRLVVDALDLDDIAARFAESFDPDRGYEETTASILSEVRCGTPWREAVGAHAPRGGDPSNSAAARVAPAALACFPYGRLAADVAERQCEVTGHTHPEARFGARVTALALARAMEAGACCEPFGIERFVSEIVDEAPDGFRDALSWIAADPAADPYRAASRLGTESRASCSVPAALYCFVSRKHEPAEAIVQAVNMPGDARSVGAMTGALACAYAGASRLPWQWCRAVENGDRARDYILDLADRFLKITLDRCDR